MDTFYFDTTGQMIVFMALQDKIDIPVSSRPKLIKIINEYMEQHDKNIKEEGVKEGLRIAQDRISGGYYEEEET